MGFKIISVGDARSLVECENCQVIDVRDQSAFAEGHIDGAHNVSDADINDFITQADPKKPLLICCYAGMMSQKFAQHFHEQGFVEVYSLEGGYAAWQQAQ